MDLIRVECLLKPIPPITNALFAKLKLPEVQKLLPFLSNQIGCLELLCGDTIYCLFSTEEEGNAAMKAADEARLDLNDVPLEATTSRFYFEIYCCDAEGNRLSATY